MTLCIAATCRDFIGHESIGAGEPHVILACDWRVETPTAGADIEIKDDMLHKRWFSLFAGAVHQARELNNLYRELFQAEEITSTGCLDQLSVPLQRLRRRLADRYVQAAFSLTYDEFLKTGKAHLPEENFRQALFDISNQRLDTELILVGFVDGRFRLFHCAGCAVQEHSTFLAIGSGAEIATTVLFQREYRQTDSVARAIYALYEAKKLAEIAPGVGRNTTYTLLGPPKDETGLDFKFWTPVAEKHLAKSFRKFGPRELRPMTLPPDFWA